jgi:hypothetical protein
MSVHDDLESLDSISRNNQHAQALQESADTAKVLAALEETGATHADTRGATLDDVKRAIGRRSD